MNQYYEFYVISPIKKGPFFMLHNPKKGKKKKERVIYCQLILLFLELMIF